MIHAANLTACNLC